MDPRWICGKDSLKISFLLSLVLQLVMIKLHVLHHYTLNKQEFSTLSRPSLWWTISNCTATSIRLGGPWVGHGLRRRWSGLWWVHKQQSKETVPSSKETSHIAARRRRPSSTCSQEYPTISNSPTAAKAAWFHHTAKTPMAPFRPSRWVLGRQGPQTRQSSCPRTSPCLGRGPGTLVVLQRLCRPPSSSHRIIAGRLKRWVRFFSRNRIKGLANANKYWLIAKPHIEF